MSEQQHPVYLSAEVCVYVCVYVCANPWHCRWRVVQCAISHLTSNFDDLRTFSTTASALSACCFSISCVCDLRSLHVESNSLVRPSVRLCERFSAGNASGSHVIYYKDGQTHQSQEDMLDEWILCVVRLFLSSRLNTFIFLVFKKNIFSGAVRF